MKAVEAPAEWRWDTSPKFNMLTALRNQHIPEYCGACWAFAATSALSDRIKILRNAAFPDIFISPQVLLSCATEENDGCEGGDGLLAYKYIYENLITDETGSPYRARGHTNGLKCGNTTLAKDCPHDGNKCFVPREYDIYEIEEYGHIVNGEEEMIQELFQRGPIVCAMAVTLEFFHNYTGGIYEDTTGYLDLNHDVSVVGYGEENGQKYWLVRNSWGTFWGESGLFRIVRGTNNMGIESDCAFAVPKNTWTKHDKHETTDEEEKDPNNETKNSDPIGEISKNSFIGYINRGCNGPCRRATPGLSNGPRVKSPVPHELFTSASIPKNFTWSNVNGVNYLSISKNQHIPVYCGSCWAHATTSALADRFNILGGLKASPSVSLSTQVIVNCQPGGGSCFGGNPLDVYEYAYLNGIPDDTCQQYIAKNSDYPLCTDLQICQDCSAPVPAAGEDGTVRCHAVKIYKKYFVKEYGRVRGADKMKNEIYHRGPIDCALEATDKLSAYKGGIFEEKGKDDLNHAISVVGFGEENGVEYWIVRNSWGSYWGEEGFFRIRMHKNNNGIETDCNWATPSYENVSDNEDAELFSLE